MKIRLTDLVTDLRGSIGGTTIKATSYGLAIQNKVAGKKTVSASSYAPPMQTLAATGTMPSSSQTTSALLASASIAWSALTSAQRQEWITWAGEHPDGYPAGVGLQRSHPSPYNKNRYTATDRGGYASFVSYTFRSLRLGAGVHVTPPPGECSIHFLEPDIWRDSVTKEWRLSYKWQDGDGPIHLDEPLPPGVYLYYYNFASGQIVPPGAPGAFYGPNLWPSSYVNSITLDDIISGFTQRVELGGALFFAACAIEIATGQLWAPFTWFVSKILPYID